MRSERTIAALDDLAGRLWEARGAILAHQRVCQAAPSDPDEPGEARARRARMVELADAYKRVKDRVMRLAWRLAKGEEWVRDPGRSWDPFSLETARFALLIEPDHSDPWYTFDAAPPYYEDPEVSIVPRPGALTPRCSARACCSHC